MADERQLEYEDEQTDDRSAQQPAVERANAGGSELPIKQGAVFGAITLIATYLSHLFLTAIATARSTPAAGMVGEGEDASLVVTEMVASWKAAGWSYLSTFGTGFEAEGEVASLGGVPNHGAASVSGAFSMSTLFLFLVTVGGVAAAGYAVARHTAADDAVEAAKAGATVAVPYFAFALLAALVMTHTFSEGPAVEALVGGEFSAGAVPGLEAADYLGSEGHVTSEIEFGPSITDAILYAGLIVPVVLGALGGVAARREDALEKLTAKVDQL
ncbi:hypothetical protein HTZ84_17105 [Haloterrigena sp. SYSU A558-1]|uniref:DUF7978 domain-containing protein n=1 Tax=Haloterrigena gelatinilytica TaxID=2741724 RepID=A0A8J8GJ56_9EURY|nr:hypothetical protein [Haloterrigena gelatinilytica]NUB90180.1 hypothetical protein [Haloterrigena gelatinilytica]NUC73999.1 hypothetical protein [Haloterrigena gelatinilytica]